MRRTWIPRLANYSNNQVILIFMLAIDTNETEALNRTTEESKLYGDLLIMKLKDSYRMWSIKTLSAMDYILESCSEQIRPNHSQPLFLRLTQDVLVNPKPLFQLFMRLSNTSNERFCAGAETVGVVVRNPGSIWYVPNYVYSSPNYGEYCQGCGFFITFSAMEELVQYGSCLEAVMYIDDAVITGVMRQQLKIPLMKIPENYITWKGPILESIARNDTADRYKQYSIMHNQPQITPTEYGEIWNYLHSNNLL